MADTNTTTVEQLYVAYFSRPADPNGLTFWDNFLATNPNGVQQMSAQFAASQEYQQTYANMDNHAVVEAVYQNLFGRVGDDAGVAFWTAALDNHTISVDNVVTAVADGAQNDDKVVYTGRVAVAVEFTQHVDQPNEIAAYSGTAANAIAKAFIGTIVDLQSGAAAINPSVVDAKIAEIVGTPSSMDTVHLLT